MARAIDANVLQERLYKLGLWNDSKAAFYELIESIPALTPPNEWVSVEDTVPDPGERVLATDGIFVGEAYRTSANTWYRHTGFPWRDCLQSIVTHWMPLPAAPDRQEEA